MVQTLDSVLLEIHHPNVLNILPLYFQNILSIYIQTTSGSVRKNDHRVQGWNPISNSFRKFNTTVYGE